MPENETPESPLDAAEIDYIDPGELTDTSELVLAEPLTEKIADAFHDTLEALHLKSDDE